MSTLRKAADTTFIALLLIVASAAAPSTAGTWEIEVRTSGAASCAEGDRRCFATSDADPPAPGNRRYGTGAPARPALFLAPGGRGEIRGAGAAGRFCFFTPARGAVIEQCSEVNDGDAFEVALLEASGDRLRLRIAVQRGGERFASELAIEAGAWTPFARDAAGRRVEVRARAR